VRTYWGKREPDSEKTSLGHQKISIKKEAPAMLVSRNGKRAKCFHKLKAPNLISLDHILP